MPTVCSFDVFDTALVRRTAFPSDVFRLVGQRIANEIGCPANRGFIGDFVASRLQAEQMSLAGREEATLDAIWMKLRDMLDLPAACGPQYELDAEREVLAPNAIVLERIAQARATGCRIVFLSDSYLPAEFVKDALRRHGAAAEGDGVYVSSALGRTKRSGSLYREMLNAEKVAANAVHHYGDNPHSDVDVPRRLGIAVTLLADAHFNEWERAILNCAAAPDEAAARLAGSMRLFRLGASREFSAGVPPRN